MSNQDGQSPTYDVEGATKVIKDSTTSVLPPTGFRTLVASQDELKALGFPRRPDPARQPAEYAFWQKMFSPTVAFEAFDFQVLSPVTAGLRGSSAQSPRRESSLNWSGAYITPRDGTIFSSIWGKFQVPTPTRPAGGLASETYHSSTWIGFDGQRRYYRSTLPQIGTAQNIDPATGAGGPTTSFFAWWQWWVRGDPAQAFPVTLMSPKVHAGDLIMCLMQVAPDRTGVSFVITNLTTSRSVQFFQTAPLTHLGQPFKIPGATAEWVMERSAAPGNPTPLQLPDYGTVVFHDCGASAINTDTGAMVERNLSGAKLIDMHVVKEKEKPERTEKPSIAKPIGSTEFLTHFR
ncbi:MULTISPECIES: A4/G1 family peptidase [Bradyrhizobium]|uniref:A4/G1 family peptidase n=1 Tax=Bradyrhizobium elkanii TaxID=29448 RepID=UPI0027151523|nr:A4/G1 family peptidase [Bradyrhizobium elkanii]WLA50978.1 A4/G1 family peptidase [Bradyrhizobium elkanii]WLB78757.1 A4/G1 family peptidase [Bradyrhizobium elkanii]